MKPLLRPEEFRDPKKLEKWEKENQQNLKKLNTRGSGVNIDMMNDKQVDSVTKMIFVEINKFANESKDTIADDVVDILEKAHGKQYKVTKQKDKDGTISVDVDNYDKFIEMEYGKNIPGMRKVISKYGKD